MKIVTLLISGALVLGMSATVFAADLKEGLKKLKLEELAEQKPKEEKLGFLSDQPIEIEKEIIAFVVGEKDFITAAEKAKGLAEISEKYKALVIEALKNRFFEKPQQAQDELFTLSEDGTLSQFALEVLLKAGANLNMENQDGGTALMMAALNGPGKIVEMLIKNGADINNQNKAGTTALMVASLKGNIEVARMLIEKDADINKQNEYGTTALIAAAESGSTAIVNLLIEKGADLNKKNKNGDTALGAAKRSGYRSQKIVEILNKEQTWQSVALDTLFKLSKNGTLSQFALTKLLKGRAYLLNRQDAYGNTALMYAIMQGHAKVVSLLIAAGAKLNIKNKDNKTALDLANQYNHTEIVKILEEAIKKQKNPNQN